MRVFENIALEEYLDQVTGGWRELFNDEFQHFYISTTLIRMIK
jgi:hypothetical protein